MQQLLESSLTQLTQPSDPEPQRQQRARGAGFSDAETANLLDLLETHLPLSRDEWDYVSSLQYAAYVGNDRTTDSLKRKFAKLHRKRIPTGDPSIPADVLQAKRVRLEMTRRAGLGDGEDAATEAAIDFVASTPTPVGPVPTRQSQDLPSPPPPRSTTSLTTPSTVPTPSTASMSTSTPKQLDVARPIVHRRGQNGRPEDNTDARFMAMMRFSLDQERLRADKLRQRWEQERQEERARREENRARRDEDREAERRQRQEDREEDRRRHQELLSLLLVSNRSAASGTSDQHAQ